MLLPQTSDIAGLGSQIEKIAMELVFAEAGKDQGLLPLNSLLGEIEEFKPVPPSLVEALKEGRGLVDEALLAGAFTAELLADLRGWVEWMQAAVTALQLNQPLPKWSLVSGVESAAPVTDVPPPAGGSLDAMPSLELPEPDIRLQLANDRDLLREFTNESQEHLQNIELGVLTLEENPTDSGTLNSIFRAFHTFKGGSGFLDLRPINGLAHELESLLDLARQQKLVIDSQVITVILAGADLLKRFIAAIEAQLSGRNAGEPIVIPTQELLRRIRAVIDEGTRTSTRVTTDRTQGPNASAREESAVPSARVGPPATHERAKRGEGKLSAPESVRTDLRATAVKVDTLKLDSLVDLVGEMVIAESIIVQNLSQLGQQNQQLSRNVAQLGRITNELQRVAMSLRMVPIRSTFQKMTRLVRDLCIKAGKNVELEMSGEETELDRTITDEMGDPLVHMIRNAMDHGIEPAATRLAHGKPAHGVIKLRAFHKGGSIIVEVEDDGAGLNRERILQKAIQNGVVAPGSQLTDESIFDLIFAPGFSTAEKVTDISGRGVGMDVVRRNIEKLRGKVEIASVEGKGSCFTMHLPLTLAIIDGLLIGVGTHRFILPTLAVRESFRPTAGMVTTVHGRAEVVNVRGRLLPLVRLHTLFGIEPRSVDPTQGILIVVESDRDSRCVLVDELLGKQEVVIKSLGDTFKRSSAVAGAAILGDGRVGLILDVQGLNATTTSPALAAGPETAQARVSNPPGSADRHFTPGHRTIDDAVSILHEESTLPATRPRFGSGREVEAAREV